MLFLINKINLKTNMIEIVNGRVFVEGKETSDPTLIGYAIIDFAETTKKDILSIALKEGDVFIEDYQNAHVSL